LARCIEDAEEIANDALMRAYRDIGSFNPTTAPIETWLRTLATNAARNFYKSPANQYESSSPQSTPIHELVRNEIMDDTVPTCEIDEIINPYLNVPGWRQLSSAQRVCLSLKDVNGFSCKEIAEMVGCSENAVRQHRKEAKKKLREVRGGT
jgi:RNA polymerase sigma-70 factor (ECF subfamily)